MPHTPMVRDATIIEIGWESPTFVCAHAHVHTHMCAHVRTHTHMCIHICVCMCMRVYAHAHTDY